MNNLNFFFFQLYEQRSKGCPYRINYNGMGACLSLDREEAKARRRSEEIDKQLTELARQEQNIIKILLLGK